MDALSRHARHTTSMGRASARPAGPLLTTGLLALVLAGGCTHRPSAVQELKPPSITAPHAGDAAVACDPRNHDVLLSWVAGDSTGFRLWFSRSADAGDTWTEPVAVSPPGEPLRLHAESSPRMTCAVDGRLGLAWSTSVEIAGRRFPASDLRFAGSADGGRTWSAAVTINDDAAGEPGSHTFHALALRPTGELYAAWLDSRPGGDSLQSDESEGHDASIHLSRSDDHGATWSPNSAQWSRVCPCCRVGMVVDAFGIPYVVFRKHYPGQLRDVVLARTGSEPIRLRTDNWNIAGCPHSGPPIALSRDGTLRVAWFTGAEGHAGVYFRQVLPERMDSVSTPVTVLRGERLPTLHVDIGEAGMSGSLLAMDADSTGKSQLTLARVESSGRRLVERFTVPGTSGATHPKIASSPASKLAYVAWSAKEADRTRLHVARWEVGR
ncbi:MAG: sialidase family protein [Candidatus Eisenbacteria bacterium]